MMERMDASASFAALLIDDKDTLLVVRTALECAGFTCEAGSSARTLERRSPRPGLALVVADSDVVDVAPLVAWRDRHGGAEPALLVLGAPLGAQGPQIPAPVGYVNDFAHVIPAASAATIERIIDDVRAMAQSPGRCGASRRKLRLSPERSMRPVTRRSVSPPQRP